MSKTGNRGIELRPNGRYQARFYSNGRNLVVGTYDSLTEAVKARAEYEQRLIG